MVNIDIVISRSSPSHETMAMTPGSMRVSMVQKMTQREIEGLFLFLRQYAINESSVEPDGQINLGGLESPAQNEVLTVLSLLLSPAD